MSRLVRKLLDGGLTRAVEALLAFLMFAMVAMLFGNVVLRYAFNSGIVMCEELSLFCFVWMSFIGAVLAMHEGTHLGMDNVVSRLPRAGKLACLAVSQVLILGCCVLLVWGSWRQHQINASTAAPVTGMSMIWIFGLGYVVGIGIGVQALARLWKIATGRITDDELVQVRESEEEDRSAGGARP
jgi:TRAP-type C4-dicarboxylate transport system permease small subunit